MKPHFLLTIALCSLIVMSCSRRSTSSLTTPPIEEAKTTSFSKDQLQLIQAGTASDPMRLFLTSNTKDSLLLRKRAAEVIANPEDPTLNIFIDRLLTTVQDSLSLGVGIAAPQVGVLKRIIWVQRFDKEGFPFEVYLNPVIKQYTKKKQNCMEGCLSIPNKQAETKVRAYAILLEYDTREGEHITEMVEDFTAVIFQHEIDHLNGILFTDLLSEEKG